MTLARALPRWLTTLLLTIAWAPAHAELFNQELFKTHLRWNLQTSREQITVSKRENQVLIETLDLALFEKLAGEMAKMKRAEGYVEAVTYEQDGFPAKPARITVTLKAQSVELFSFYRDVDRKWIMDFWVNADALPTQAASFQKPPVQPVAAKAEAPKPKPKPKQAAAAAVPVPSILEVIPVDAPKRDKVNPGYRDYRYGASFLWDYPALLPPLERDVLLESKIPEYLHPIKDRELLDDRKEAHVQLSINLYRDEKWGLLNKSLTLYEKKYGSDANADINEWMKINALFRSNLTKKDRTLQASAMNLLQSLLQRSNDYEIKRASARYLIQYYVDKGDFFKALELAKGLFVESRAQYDHDMVILAANVILNALARLKQDDKIAEFLSDKKLAALLAPQTEFAYATYALLAAGKTGEILKRYAALEKSLVKPVHPSILYNVAEAFFREARFADAIRLFDQFVADWAHYREAPSARLRIGMAYEITNRSAEETLVLYRNAIDRSPDPRVRFEAKLRYVGLRVGRKLDPTPADLETIVFLEQADDEKAALTAELRQLLWLVRLRTFLAQKNYDKALSYLATIPVDSLKPADRRVFEADGAEIVYGVVQQSYLAEDYTRAAKTWEVYRDRYDRRIAGNPYMNFIAADSYLKLGLYQSFDRAAEGLRTMAEQEPREYPLWVDRGRSLPVQDMVAELDLIRSVAAKEWDQAEAKLASYPVSLRATHVYPFYRGLVAFQRGKWSQAAEDFEKVLLTKTQAGRLTPRQMADLLMSYVESLYNLKDPARFRTVVEALAKDIQRSKSAPILNVGERVSYLLVETLAGEDKPNWPMVESQVREFQKQFVTSPYTARMEYLLGRALLRNGKLDEGKQVLRALIEKQEIPLYVREMARTELSALELKDKRL